MGSSRRGESVSREIFGCKKEGCAVAVYRIPRSAPNKWEGIDPSREVKVYQLIRHSCTAWRVQPVDRPSAHASTFPSSPSPYPSLPLPFLPPHASPCPISTAPNPGNHPKTPGAPPQASNVGQHPQAKTGSAASHNMDTIVPRAAPARSIVPSNRASAGMARNSGRVRVCGVRPVMRGDTRGAC